MAKWRRAIRNPGGISNHQRRETKGTMEQPEAVLQETLERIPKFPTFEEDTPKPMAQLHPFIHFNGNAETAFALYRSVFGGEFTEVIRFKDLPSDGAGPDWGAEGEKVWRITLPIGGQGVLMGSDVPEVLGTVNENENRSKIRVRAESQAEAEHLFAGLSEGGAVECHLEAAPWGGYFGMFRDRFGIEWMVETSHNPN